MAHQTKILKRTFTGQVDVINPDTGAKETKQYNSGTGVLIGGTPGQIYDVAYGPVVHTTTLAAAADIGSFVAGQGIIINAPEYALYGAGEVAQGGALAPSLTLPAGSVVSCMTAGHVWMTREAFEAMGDAMNAHIIWQQPVDDGDSSADTGKDLIVVEVNGMTAYGPDSTANG